MPVGIFTAEREVYTQEELAVLNEALVAMLLCDSLVVKVAAVAMFAAGVAGEGRFNLFRVFLPTMSLNEMEVSVAIRVEALKLMLVAFGFRHVARSHDLLE